MAFWFGFSEERVTSQEVSSMVNIYAYQSTDTECTCRFSKYGHRVGISSKMLNVFLDPLESCNLVQ